MSNKAQIPASAGVRKLTKDDVSEGQPVIELAKAGHPDRRFGIIPKLGKDGCGY